MLQAFANSIDFVIGRPILLTFFAAGIPAFAATGAIVHKWGSGWAVAGSVGLAFVAGQIGTWAAIILILWTMAQLSTGPDEAAKGFMGWMRSMVSWGMLWSLASAAVAVAFLRARPKSEARFPQNLEPVSQAKPIPAALPEPPSQAAILWRHIRDFLAADDGVPVERIPAGLLLHWLLPGALLLMSGFAVVGFLVNANYNLSVQDAITYLIALATMVAAAGWILFGPIGLVNIEGRLRVGVSLSAAWSLAVVVFLILDQVFLESSFFPAQALVAIVLPWLLGWSCFGLYLWAVRKS